MADPAPVRKLSGEEQFGRMREAGDDFNDGMSAEPLGDSKSEQSQDAPGEPKAWQRLRYDHVMHTTPEEKARFESMLEFECCGRTLQLHQTKIKSQASVGRTVWDASLVLAKYLERRAAADASFLREKRVLELGAGCAAAGIAASLLGASQVVFTDVHRILGHMRKNVESNLGGGASSGSFLIKELDWGRTPVKKFRPPFDLVIGQCFSCIFQLQCFSCILIVPHTCFVRRGCHLHSTDRGTDAADSCETAGDVRPG
jgi:predicted nicotinamide N-methyase